MLFFCISTKILHVKYITSNFTLLFHSDIWKPRVAMDLSSFLCTVIL